MAGSVLTRLLKSVEKSESYKQVQIIGIFFHILKYECICSCEWNEPLACSKLLCAMSDLDVLSATIFIIAVIGFLFGVLQSFFLSFTYIVKT